MENNNNSKDDTMPAYQKLDESSHSESSPTGLTNIVDAIKEIVNTVPEVSNKDALKTDEKKEPSQIELPLIKKVGGLAIVEVKPGSDDESTKKTDPPVEQQPPQSKANENPAILIAHQPEVKVGSSCSSTSTKEMDNKEAITVKRDEQPVKIQKERERKDPARNYRNTLLCAGFPTMDVDKCLQMANGNLSLAMEYLTNYRIEWKFLEKKLTAVPRLLSLVLSCAGEILSRPDHKNIPIKQAINSIITNRPEYELYFIQYQNFFSPLNKNYVIRKQILEFATELERTLEELRMGLEYFACVDMLVQQGAGVKEAGDILVWSGNDINKAMDSVIRFYNTIKEKE